MIEDEDKIVDIDFKENLKIQAAISKIVGIDKESSFLSHEFVNIILEQLGSARIK